MASPRYASLALPAWSEDPLPEIRQLGTARTIVALDDDPTGTQTVRDVPVLTRWSEERLTRLADEAPRLAFLLTNSRSLPPREAEAVARDVGSLLCSAALASGRDWSVISRSDSTLRGHFPVEIDALAEGLGVMDARVLLAPFFGDGGRLTIDGIHHLERDGVLTPVAETEFAADPVFGYRSSDLRAWVAERTGDDRRTDHVSLASIRSEGPAAVQRWLSDLPDGAVLVCDAASERDIEVVALGALRAELDGVPLIARTAASYVRARAGQAQKGPLEDRLLEPGRPGLVVVGSHVPTSTAQLARLMEDPPTELEPLELPVAPLIEGGRETMRLTSDLGDAADAALRSGRTAVIFTSRDLLRGTDARSDLRIAATVSGALVAAVRAVSVRPHWVMGKGGITSSDIATRALAVSEATVLGPLLPGVPLWRCGPDARWPGLPYTVFPGNVGGPDTLREAVARLCGR